MINIEDLTLVRQGIHNPGEPRHYMRLKPVNGHVRIRLGQTVLAESDAAIRLLEVGRDLYDPVVYLPRADVLATLTPVAGKSSHCPLKGDACYYTLDDDDPIAWRYDRPLPHAEGLRDLIAFYPDRVTVEESGALAAG
ncbi:MAG: DUF427 domain-containing protein [Burkholderiaceae bacterium]